MTPNYLRKIGNFLPFSLENTPNTPRKFLRSLFAILSSVDSKILQQMLSSARRVLPARIELSDTQPEADRFYRNVQILSSP